jgi:hypothetical protein
MLCLCISGGILANNVECMYEYFSKHCHYECSVYVFLETLVTENTVFIYIFYTLSLEMRSLCTSGDASVGMRYIDVLISEGNLNTKRCIINTTLSEFPELNST